MLNLLVSVKVTDEVKPTAAYVTEVDGSFPTFIICLIPYFTGSQVVWDAFVFLRGCSLFGAFLLDLLQQLRSLVFLEGSIARGFLRHFGDVVLLLCVFLVVLHLQHHFRLRLHHVHVEFDLHVVLPQHVLLEALPVDEDFPTDLAGVLPAGGLLLDLQDDVVGLLHVTAEALLQDEALAAHVAELEVVLVQLGLLLFDAREILRFVRVGIQVLVETRLVVEIPSADLAWEPHLVVGFEVFRQAAFLSVTLITLLTHVLLVLAVQEHVLAQRAPLSDVAAAYAALVARFPVVAFHVLGVLSLLVEPFSTSIAVILLSSQMALPVFLEVGELRKRPPTSTALV